MKMAELGQIFDELGEKYGWARYCNCATLLLISKYKEVGQKIVEIGQLMNDPAAIDAGEEFKSAGGALSYCCNFYLVMKLRSGWNAFTRWAQTLDANIKSSNMAELTTYAQDFKALYGCGTTGCCPRPDRWAEGIGNCLRREFGLPSQYY